MGLPLVVGLALTTSQLQKLALKVVGSVGHGFSWVSIWTFSILHEDVPSGQALAALDSLAEVFEVMQGVNGSLGDPPGMTVELRVPMVHVGPCLLNNTP